MFLCFQQFKPQDVHILFLTTILYIFKRFCVYNLIYLVEDFLAYIISIILTHEVPDRVQILKELRPRKYKTVFVTVGVYLC